MEAYVINDACNQHASLKTTKNKAHLLYIQAWVIHVTQFHTALTESKRKNALVVWALCVQECRRTSISRSPCAECALSMVCEVARHP